MAICQIVIDANLNAQELIQNHLIGNPNFPASNFSMVNGNQFAGPNSVGYFTNNVTDFQFGNGIVLSTGNVLEIPGPNTSLLSTPGFNWPGDIELSNLTNSPDLFNASSLQFDFVADVSAVTIDFLMASEEYDGSSECQWADIFAIILTNTITGISENLAVIPGTDTPITTTTVHGMTTSCGTSNEDYFDRYNHTNAAPSFPAEDSAINLNGQTKIFVVISDLIVGDTYTVKIAIADEGDSVWDSALFVRNGSFGAYPEVAQAPNDIVIEDTDNDGVELFDLTVNEDLMLGDIDGAVYHFSFYYFRTLSDAENNMNPIPYPETYTNTDAIEDIYVKMINTYTETGLVVPFQITIDASLLAVDEFNNPLVTLYPNPILDVLYIDGHSNIKQIDIYSMNGQQLSTQSYKDVESTSINFSDYANGMYLIKIHTDAGSSYKRILK